MNLKQNKLDSIQILSFLLLILALATSAAFAQKSDGKSGDTANKGGGNGGGSNPTPTPTPTPVPQTNPLPQTAPAPDVIYRESFGSGPDLLRPAGSKGTLKESYIHTPLNNFWIEYPGGKSTVWSAPAEGQTWRLCGASENPYEMFSPLQVFQGFSNNGCVASEWTDNPAQNPTALLAFTAPNAAYEISFNGYPAPIAGKYLAVGLSNSAESYSNLENSGSVALFLKPLFNTTGTILYELRAGGLSGTLLASGETYFEGWNQMKLRYNPNAKTVSGSVNGTELGTFPLNLGAPRYAGFEGVGIGDNFVIRKLQ